MRIRGPNGRYARLTVTESGALFATNKNGAFRALSVNFVRKQLGEQAPQVLEQRNQLRAAFLAAKPRRKPEPEPEPVPVPVYPDVPSGNLLEREELAWVLEEETLQNGRHPRLRDFLFAVEDRALYGDFPLEGDGFGALVEFRPGRFFVRDAAGHTRFVSKEQIERAKAKPSLPESMTCLQFDMTIVLMDADIPQIITDSFSIRDWSGNIDTFWSDYYALMRDIRDQWLGRGYKSKRDIMIINSVEPCT